MTPEVEGVEISLATEAGIRRFEVEVTPSAVMSGVGRSLLVNAPVRRVARDHGPMAKAPPPSRHTAACVTITEEEFSTIVEGLPEWALLALRQRLRDRF